MPYKSRAQQRLFHHLVSQGKLAPEVAEEYDAASKGKKIPQFVKRKAFGGQIEAKAGVRCPACDYPLDSAPVALDAGEGCPRCGYGDAKEVPHKAMGGEIQQYAEGGEVERKTRGESKYKAKSADEFLKMLDSAVARVKRVESGYPYNPAPWHERRTSPDASIPRETKGWFQLNRMDEFARAPTPELAKKIQEYAEKEAAADPEYAEKWRKNTVGRFGDAKAADRYAHGGEVGSVCEHCGSDMKADLKELYPSKKRRLDDGKIGFAKAIKRR
jgi:hypothetical protein